MYNPYSLDKCINAGLEMKIRWQHGHFAGRYPKSAWSLKHNVMVIALRLYVWISVREYGMLLVRHHIRYGLRVWHQEDIRGTPYVISAGMCQFQFWHGPSRLIIRCFANTFFVQLRGSWYLRPMIVSSKIKQLDVFFFLKPCNHWCFGASWRQQKQAVNMTVSSYCVHVW